MTLERIAHVEVPTDLVGQTDEHLRRAGRDGCELFVLWTGAVEGAAFRVRTAHVPRQTSYRGHDGLCVRVDGDELNRLNHWLYEHGEILGVQVHTHPTDAYHSDTDDAFAIVTVLGGISIVVPNFARSGVTGDGRAVYRLSLGGWDELSEDAARHLVRVTA